MTRVELKERPNNEAIAQLPWFSGLTLDRITVLKGAEDFADALNDIEQAACIGFDTESKPTFTKEAINTGPHLIQLATSDRAFLIQVSTTPPIEFLKAVLESPNIIKVGFGLKSDRELLGRKLGLRLNGVVDLSHELRSLGYKNDLGVKSAVAIVLGQRLRKSKSVTTSNWSLPTLNENQLLYAANDAFAALAIYRAMKKSSPA
jgi:ribonuclease D